MGLVTWVTDCSGANKAWIEKFKSGKFAGDNKDDVLLFFKALTDFGTLNEDYREVVEDALVQYGEIVQYYEVRNTDVKIVFMANEKEQKVGTFTGRWQDVQAELGLKNPCSMEMIPEAMKQIMSGNPNTDSFFMAGNLTVAQGHPIKLAILGREFVTTFYEENGIDP